MGGCKNEIKAQGKIKIEKEGRRRCRKYSERIGMMKSKRVK